MVKIDFVQQHQQASTLLLKHQKESQDAGIESLAISSTIITFNNQILALKDQIAAITIKIIDEKFKLASVDKIVAANSSIVEYICGNLKRLSQEIQEVHARCLMI
jgi:uncharacterized membrane protein YheB (UPF0754 family)